MVFTCFIVPFCVTFTQDKEVANGGQPPRILSLDAYFINEVEKVEKDPDTGRRYIRMCTS